VVQLLFPIFGAGEDGMADRVVTARGDRIAYPYVVATEPAQRRVLVDLALRDPGYTGPSANTHFNVYFYLWDRPVGMGLGDPPRRWVQIGFFARFAGLLYVDDTDAASEDWAWIAVRRQPIVDPPTVYYDQESRTSFPPRSIMTVEEVRDVLLEWFDSGERPGSVRWLTVNDLRWKLDEFDHLAL
jgi:hypothetical protein